MGSRIVGVKIGASRISAACVARNGSARLDQVAQHPLPPGLVARGEVQDPDALAVELRQFFSQHRLPRSPIRLGVASNRISVRVIELSDISDPLRLANAVRFRAQEALPIPLDEAVLDFQVVGERTEADGSVVSRVVVAVAYRDLIERFARAARQAGLHVVGIDLEAFALARALVGAAVPPASDQPDAAVAVISIGAERSTLAVASAAACEFTRVLDWGGRELTATVARALDLPLPEADELKRKLSLSESGLSPDDEIATLVRPALLGSLQLFARELVSTLQFYQNQPGALHVREVVLAGGTAELAGLSAALQRLIGVPVRTGDPSARLSLGKRVQAGGAGPSFAIPIGLAVAL